MAAGWYFNWVMAGDWMLRMPAIGGGCGLLSGAWGMQRLTRVLSAN
jgi:hypothetical protein